MRRPGGAGAFLCLTLAAFFSAGIVRGASSGTKMADSTHRLTAHVRKLAEDIGERNFRKPAPLADAADYIAGQLAEAGLEPVREGYRIEDQEFHNIYAERKGSGVPAEMIVVGAHYDTVPGSPGADDNASGVAVMLELAKAAAVRPNGKTLRFVAFVNEEPPFFRTGFMGSRVHAHGLKKERVKVAGMVSLEMLGYYSEEAGSQSYPPFLSLFYPDRGDFIGIVGNLSSRALVKEVARAFSVPGALRTESISTVSLVPGVDFSDHASFWKYGFRAVMVTDTAFYRNPYYHTAEDTWEKLDYGKMQGVLAGLARWLEAAGR